MEFFCILFNIDLINTKLENVANFNGLFLTTWVSCCLSQNKATHSQPFLISNLVMETLFAIVTVLIVVAAVEVIVVAFMFIVVTVTALLAILVITATAEVITVAVLVITFMACVALLRSSRLGW